MTVEAITPLEAGCEGMCLGCGDHEGTWHVPQLSPAPIFCDRCFDDALEVLRGKVAWAAIPSSV